jgi:hypothetical protein
MEYLVALAANTTFLTEFYEACDRDHDQLFKLQAVHAALTGPIAAFLKTSGRPMLARMPIIRKKSLCTGPKK